MDMYVAVEWIIPGLPIHLLAEHCGLERSRNETRVHTFRQLCEDAGVFQATRPMTKGGAQ